jgi:hypothetical protein
LTSKQKVKLYLVPIFKAKVTFFLNWPGMNVDFHVDVRYAHFFFFEKEKKQAAKIEKQTTYRYSAILT